MDRKKDELLQEEMVPEANVSEPTDMLEIAEQPESGAVQQEEGMEAAASQTGLEPEEGEQPQQEDAPPSQTDSGSADGNGNSEPEEPDTGGLPQTGSEMGSAEVVQGSGAGAPDAAPQTEPEKPRRRGRPRKSAAAPVEPEPSDAKSGDNPSQSDDVSAEPEEKPAPKTARRTRRTQQLIPSAGNILSIDGSLAVETEADKARNDLLDLMESMKTGRILAGTIQGVERSDNGGEARAVLYHGDFKVLIPASQAVDPPEDFRGRLPDDVLHYMITKRLGAEVDYIVKGIDSDSGMVAASRLEAMAMKRRQYYFGTDRDGNNLLYADLCAEARVVSVIRAGIFIDLFGVESYIPLRELSYQRLLDAANQFQPGQRILVKILEIDRTDRNRIRVRASVKQASQNPYEKALRRYVVGNRYVGTVSMVDTNGVFVALDGGIDCLCSYPKRGRPPKGARATVRILGINHDSNRIWGAITHIAVPR